MRKASPVPVAVRSFGLFWKAFAQFEKSAPDPGFDRPKRLFEQVRDLRMCEPAKEGQLDGLALVGRQTLQRCPDQSRLLQSRSLAVWPHRIGFRRGFLELLVQAVSALARSIPVNRPMPCDDQSPVKCRTKGRVEGRRFFPDLH